MTKLVPSLACLAATLVVSSAFVGGPHRRPLPRLAQQPGDDQQYEADRLRLLESDVPGARALGEILDLYFDFYLPTYGTRSSALHDPLAAAIAAGGKLDRIVHLAALYDPGRIADLDPEKAAQLVTVNLTGSFHIAQVGPRLLRKHGQLALCGSVAGYVGLPQGQIYSATKAGVINLAESLRAERPDVDVRLICPGFALKPDDFTHA